MQKRKIYPLPEHACKTNHTDAIIGINLKLSPPTVGTVEPRLSGFHECPELFLWSQFGHEYFSISHDQDP